MEITNKKSCEFCVEEIVQNLQEALTSAFLSCKVLPAVCPPEIVYRGKSFHLPPLSTGGRIVDVGLVGNLLNPDRHFVGDFTKVAQLIELPSETHVFAQGGGYGQYPGELFFNGQIDGSHQNAVVTVINDEPVVMSLEDWKYFSFCQAYCCSKNESKAPVIQISLKGKKEAGGNFLDLVRQTLGGLPAGMVFLTNSAHTHILDYAPEQQMTIEELLASLKLFHLGPDLFLTTFFEERDYGQVHAHGSKNGHYRSEAGFCQPKDVEFIAWLALASEVVQVS